MKSIIFCSFLFFGFNSYSQSTEKLDNAEINCVIVVSTSSKSEIYYSDGSGEIIKSDIAKAKELEIDAQERSIALITGNILKHGFELTSTNTTSTGASRIFFTRK